MAEALKIIDNGLSFQVYNHQDLVIAKGLVGKVSPAFKERLEKALGKAQAEVVSLFDYSDYNRLIAQVQAMRKKTSARLKVTGVMPAKESGVALGKTSQEVLNKGILEKAQDKQLSNNAGPTLSLRSNN